MKCPLCKKEVNSQETFFEYIIKGRVFYFCSDKCRIEYIAKRHICRDIDHLWKWIDKDYHWHECERCGATHVIPFFDYEKGEINKKESENYDKLLRSKDK